MTTELHPANQLALARTVLANERTLLAYFRGSLGAAIGGAGLIKFFDHRAYAIGGAVLLAVAVAWLVVGIRRYLKTRRLISDIDPEDWQQIEGIVKRQNQRTRWHH